MFSPKKKRFHQTVDYSPSREKNLLARITSSAVFKYVSLAANLLPFDVNVAYSNGSFFVLSNVIHNNFCPFVCSFASDEQRCVSILKKERSYSADHCIFKISLKMCCL